jgi:amidase
MVPLEFGSDIGGSIRVPSAFCGLWGHKPSYNLVPQRGHSPPGFDGADPPLNVVGPIARTVGDLVLALGILAGPGENEEAAYRLDLPSPRHERLADFRVLIVDSHPLAALDSEIREALHGLAARIEREGAIVARQSDRLPDLVASQATYWTLLMTTMSRGGPPQPGLENGAISAHTWMNALDSQLEFRRRWAHLFEAFDIVLAPVMGVVAFAHDQADFNSRIHVIDGVPTPYAAQIAWPGLATLANLPATAIPVGKTKGGLPIGLQAIGPYLEDRTTLAFAQMVSRL